MRNILLRIYRFLFARVWAAKFNQFVFDCALRGLGILNYESSNASGETFFIRRLLPKLLSSAKPVFMDVGANVGHYSESLRDSYPTAAIFAFEPNPKAFLKLEARLNDKVRSINIGLSDSVGELSLFDRADDQGSEHASLYSEVISEIHGAKADASTIEVTTIDLFCEANKISEVALLKVDTEGHELKVMLGASKMIREGRIGIVQIEFNEMNRVSKCFYHDLISLFPKHKFYRLLPSGLLNIPAAPVHQEIFAFQNLIGIPAELSLADISR